MAKGIIRDAGPDDPIYNGKFVISSGKSKSKPIASRKTSPTDTIGHPIQSPNEEKINE